MQPRKRLLIVTAMVAALAVLAPSAAVASEGGSHSRALHITKECTQYFGKAGQFCTITSSNLEAIPVGSRVIYEHDKVGAVLETDITLDPPGPGDVAFGHVHLPLPSGPGVAVFTGGTGKFVGFNATVDVTPQPEVTRGWHWDGTYSFTHGNFYQDKTCSASAAEPLGYFCTVQHSSFGLFPAGTEVHYAATSKANVVRATITISGGSTTGLCTWSSDVDAVCRFKTGTGRLDDFHLRVVVTANADASVWYWDGRYHFEDENDD